MFDSSKSLTIYKSKKLPEIENFFSRHETVLLFGGGTHIMRKAAKYPKMPAFEVIDLKDISSLEIVQKSFDYVEIGSSVSLGTLAEANFIPRIISKCLYSSVPDSVKKMATIAGTLVPDGIIYDLAAPLFVCKSYLDIKRRKEGGKIINERISISDFYKSGNKKNNDIFIEKIFFPKMDLRYRGFYKKYSSSFFHPELSIVMALTFFVSDDVVNDVSFAVCYADRAVSYMTETARVMDDVAMTYLNSSGVNNIRKTFINEIKTLFPSDERNSTAVLLFDSIIEEMQLQLL